MSTESKHEGVPEAGVAEILDRALVRIALKDILKSKPFHGSKQCSDLLRYIVEHSLSFDETSLKERVIGVSVFGRLPSYDTADDPVVRVRAADVRKRLAQYYQSQETGFVPVHIEILPGSYKAFFRLERTPLSTPAEETAASTPPPTAPSEAPARTWSLSWKIPALAIVVALCATAYWFLRIDRSTHALFWEPLTKSEQPVLVYLGTNVGYIFSPEFLDSYRSSRGIANNGPEFVVDLPPDGSIKVRDLVPIENTFITTGDLAAIAQLLTLMDTWKKPFVLRSGRDLSFGDLRNRPSVLVGGFNNPWTLQVTRDLPFFFQQGTRIEDRRNTGRNWSTPTTRSGDTEDYAIVARLLQSKTGGPVIIVAGIGEFGTQAAAEFVSNPEKIKEYLRTAPRNWREKNLEFVLRVKVIQFTPVMVDVIDQAYW